jgi:hypothetical protein
MFQTHWLEKLSPIQSGPTLVEIENHSPFLTLFARNWPGLILLFVFDLLSSRGPCYFIIGYMLNVVVLFGLKPSLVSSLGHQQEVIQVRTSWFVQVFILLMFQLRDETGDSRGPFLKRQGIKIFIWRVNRLLGLKYRLFRLKMLIL